MWWSFLAQSGAADLPSIPIGGLPPWLQWIIGIGLFVAGTFLKPVLDTIADTRKARAAEKKQDVDRADKAKDEQIADLKVEKTSLLGELKETRSQRDECEKHRAKMEGRMSAIEDTVREHTETVTVLQSKITECEDDRKELRCELDEIRRNQSK